MLDGVTFLTRTYFSYFGISSEQETVFFYVG